jgi:hypothetical protein
MDCVFLGYAIHSVGYRFLIINSSVPDMAVDTIMKSRDATFFEDVFSMKINTPDMSSHDSIFVPESHKPVIHAGDKTQGEIPEENNNTITRKSKIHRVVKSFGEDFIIYLVDDTPTIIVEAYNPLLTLTYGWKRCKVRWIQLCRMELRKWLIILMDVNLWGVNGC